MKSAAHSYEVRGKVLAYIIGYGHIGTQIGVLAEQLGMSVMYYDIENKLALGNAKPVKKLDQLLAAADVIQPASGNPADEKHDFSAPIGQNAQRKLSDQRLARHRGRYC